MSKSNAWETALLGLLFNNANVAGVGDATGLRGSSTAGVLYLSLHTADPGETGTQTTSEISYGSYARVSVVRSGVGWTVTGNSVSPAAIVVFPIATSGSGTATYVGVGTDSSGSGTLLYYGALTPSIAVSTGVAPVLTSASTITES